MSVYLSVCISFYLSICLFDCLSLCRSVGLSVYLSVCLSISQSVGRSVCLCVLECLYVPVSWAIPVPVPVTVPVPVPMHLSILHFYVCPHVSIACLYCILDMGSGTWQCVESFMYLLHVCIACMHCMTLLHVSSPCLRVPVYIYCMYLFHFGHEQWQMTTRRVLHVSSPCLCVPVFICHMSKWVSVCLHMNRQCVCTWIVSVAVHEFIWRGTCYGVTTVSRID